MKFLPRRKTCIIFFTIWHLLLAVQVPSDLFDIGNFMKQITSNGDGGLTYYKTPYINPHSRIISTSEQCARKCYITSPPKVCYYRFIVEYYTTVGGACDLCVKNASNHCQCVLVDGIEKSIITVNRQFPGPLIEVCKDDTVVVDVHNVADGSDVSIHWHGILQHGTPYYDGVPFVTQCPIPKGTAFRYNFKVSKPGTHFWHSHSGFQKVDGISGGIIVREANDIHQRLYDYDDFVLIINDWLYDYGVDRFPGRLKTDKGQDTENILINGKGQYVDPVTKIPTNTPLEMFEVVKGERYRFRIINACALTCPVQLYIQGHKLQVIATDGEPVEPEIVDSIVSLAAERYDFVLHANQPVNYYWIQVKARGICESKEIQQLAILKYKTTPDTIPSAPPSFDDNSFVGRVLNPLDFNCDNPRDDAVCINELRSAYPTNPELLKETPDVKLFLPFRFLPLSKNEVFSSKTYNKFIVVGNGLYFTALIDEISHISPSSPLISQYRDNDPDQFCDGDHKPASCGLHCVCTHKIEIPLNAVVEVCLVDEVRVPFMYHPFHLHGYSFSVMGMGRLPNASEEITLEKAIALDMKKGLRTRYSRPPSKDTLPVPNNGFSCFRFIAYNPGFWYFHCHFLYHLSVGMSLIFQVGNRSDMPPVPNNFPKCGNFLPDLH
ncbi:hypothetical protein FQA39_LY08649 [Lamprigera yunnana]|nr:hypothetical protein FQA39_LY08649 [Lamprigera yunnana]